MHATGRAATARRAPDAQGGVLPDAGSEQPPWLAVQVRLISPAAYAGDVNVSFVPCATAMRRSPCRLQILWRRTKVLTVLPFSV